MVIEVTDFSSSLGDTLAPLLKAVNVLSDDGVFTPQNFNANSLGDMVNDNAKVEQLLEFIEHVLPEPLIYYKSIEDFTFKNNSTNDTIEEEWYQIVQGDSDISTPTLYATLIRADADISPAKPYQVGIGARISHLISGIELGIRFSIPLFQFGNSGFKAMLWNETPEDDPFSRISITLETGGESPLCEAGGMSIGSVSFNGSFGPCGKAIELALHEFKLTADGQSQNLVIDFMADNFGDIFGGLLNSILTEFSANLGSWGPRLLEMFGINGSNDDDFEFPSIDLSDLLSGLFGNGSMEDVLGDWFWRFFDFDDISNSSIKDWIGNLLSLFSGQSNDHSFSVGGAGSEINPWTFDLGEWLTIAPNWGTIQAKLFVKEGSGGCWEAHFGLGYAKSTTDAGTSVNVDVNLELWLLSASLCHGNVSFQMAPKGRGHLCLLGSYQSSSYGLLVPQSDFNIAGQNLACSVGSLEAGFDYLDGTLNPILSVNNVNISDFTIPTVNLLSKDLPLNLSDLAEDLIESKLLPLFDDGGVLRMFGSLIGLVPPLITNDVAFEASWVGSGFETSVMDLLTDPVQTIRNFYGELTTTTCTYGGETHHGVAILFDSVCRLLAHMQEANPTYPELTGQLYGFSKTDIDESQDGNIHYSYPFFSYGDEVEIEYECSVDDATGTLSFNLISQLFKRDWDNNTIVLNAPIRILNAVFESDGSGFQCDLKILDEISMELRLFSSDERIELIKLGSCSLGFVDVLAFATWQRATGFSWEIDMESPALWGDYPSIRALVEADSDDGISLYDKLCSFTWDGANLTQSFDEIVLDTHDTTSVTVICGDGSFELPIIRENFGVESVRFGPNGLDLDISSFELEDVSGFISQMLMYRGGRVGLFLSVFFGLHPDVVFLNFGAIAEKNGLQIPTWYSSPAIGDWPEEWRVMHTPNPSSFGMGPLSIPIDWPCLDWSSLHDNPLEAVREQVIRLFSSASASGELFCFGAMRWIYALLHGHVPSLGLPDVGWGVASETTMGASMLAVPDIPLRFEGEGSYRSPWKLVLRDTLIGTFSFIVWIGPDGPSASMIAKMASSLEPPTLEDLDEVGTVDVTSEETTDEQLSRFVDVMYEMTSFSERFRSAIGGRPKDDLLQSIIALNNFISESDGLVHVNEQMTHWSGVGTNHVFDSVFAQVDDAPLHESVISNIQQALSSSLPLTASRLVLVHPPWQSALIWTNLLNEIAASSDIPFTVSLNSLNQCELAHHVVYIENSSTSLDSLDVPEQDVLILQLGSQLTWDMEIELRLTELVNLLGAEHGDQSVVLVGHSSSCEAIRSLSSMNTIASIVAIASPNPLYANESDNLWRDGLMVMRNLGLV
mgnify:CR=1 FL=1